MGAFPADSAVAAHYIELWFLPPPIEQQASQGRGVSMKSWSSWIYLAVTFASVVFATLQPAQLLALEQSLVAAAREGWAVPWAVDESAGPRN